ncbi:MAG: FAD-binding oxidoreductase [Candidatus Omnitrophica bacterium]|nr:FAD-binding oxidoreductase [Candidatus Omnitrophota bacterium]
MITKSDSTTIKSYLEDSSNLHGGHADKVLIPENTAELSSILIECTSKKMPVTISGGGTTTTGSRIPFGGIVVSTEKLNRIISIDKRALSCVVEAGATVDDLQSACGKEGLFYTSHPTEKNAFLGGTIATNASGARSYRYGPTRKAVKRLKMVLATGEIFELRRGEKLFTGRGVSFGLPGGRRIEVALPSYDMPNVKNAAGYFVKDDMDLIDLFIGQEGTLSVITEAELGLELKPPEIRSCFAFFKDEENSWAFAEDLKGKKEWKILSVEYFSENALKLLRRKNPNVPPASRGAIFFEEEGEEGQRYSAADRWLKFIKTRGGSVDDTWVAMNEKDAENFTSFRYAIPEAVNEIVKASGFRKFSTDIAVPGGNFLEMMRFYKDLFRDDGIRNVVFGHIGENHVHANALPVQGAELRRAESICLEFVKKGVSLGGTVSAEHGIGKIKHMYLKEMYGDKGISEMVMVKKALDPGAILGLDNIFPKELLQ